MAEGTCARPRRSILRRAVAVTAYRAPGSAAPVPALSRGSFAGKFFPPGIRKLFIHSPAAPATLTLGVYARFSTAARNWAERTEVAARQGRPHSVLVGELAEDDPTSSKVLNAVLSPCGNMDRVADGDEALKAFREVRA